MNVNLNPGDFAAGLLTAGFAIWLIPSLVTAPMLIALGVACGVAGRFGARGIPAAAVIVAALVVIQLFVYDLGNPTIRSAAQSFDAFVTNLS